MRLPSLGDPIILLRGYDHVTQGAIGHVICTSRPVRPQYPIGVRFPGGRIIHFSEEEVTSGVWIASAGGQPIGAMPGCPKLNKIGGLP